MLGVEVDRLEVMGLRPVASPRRLGDQAQQEEGPRARPAVGDGPVDQPLGLVVTPEVGQARGLIEERAGRLGGRAPAFFASLSPRERAGVRGVAGRSRPEEPLPGAGGGHGPSPPGPSPGGRGEAEGFEGRVFGIGLACFGFALPFR